MNTKNIILGSFLIFLPSLLVHFTQIVIVDKYGFNFKGEFELYNSILLLSSTIFSLNIYTAITLFVSNEYSLPKNFNKLKIYTGLPQIIFSAIILCFYQFNNMYLINNLFFFSIGIYLNHLTNLRIAILNGFQKILLSKFILVLGPLVTLIFLLILPFNEYLIIYIFILPFTVNFLSAEIINTKFFKNISCSESDFHIFKLTWRIYLISIFQILFQRLFMLFVLPRESFEDVGSFALANTFSQMLLIPITFLTLSIISNGSLGKHVFFKYLYNSLLFLIAITFLTEIFIYKILFIKSVFPFLYKLNFISNARFINDLRILIFTVPFQGLTLLIISFFVRNQLINKYFLANMILSIPIILIIYIVMHNLNMPNRISNSFAIAIILNCFFSYLIFHFVKIKHYNSLL